jgi:hypothetical protein
MKNIITCKNCGTENPSYNFTCLKCKSYLRERVVNIDFFNLVGLLIESPAKAFRKIIYAEHKNFVSLVLFLVTIKLLINSAIIYPYFSPNLNFLNHATSVFIFSIILFIIIIFIFSYLLKIISKIVGVKTRVKDNFSIIVYSFLPMIFSIIFILPVELVLFGGYLFSRNPTPFLLKPVPSYVLLGIELLILIWCFVLTFFAIKSTTPSKLFSAACAIVINIGINAIPIIVLFF